VLSQLNRQCEIENRVPQLSDLKETGTAEEDADVVLFVHRPERYAKNHGREDLRGHAEFIIAKQRNGPTGRKNMVFLDSIQKFECAASEGRRDG
jgi:replicative DNA helicase